MSSSDRTPSRGGTKTTPTARPSSQATVTPAASTADAAAAKPGATAVVGAAQTGAQPRASAFPQGPGVPMGNVTEAPAPAPPTVATFPVGNAVRDVGLGAADRIPTGVDAAGDPVAADETGRLQGLPNTAENAAIKGTVTGPTEVGVTRRDDRHNIEIGGAKVRMLAPPTIGSVAVDGVTYTAHNGVAIVDAQHVEALKPFGLRELADPDERVHEAAKVVNLARAKEGDPLAADALDQAEKDAARREREKKDAEKQAEKEADAAVKEARQSARAAQRARDEEE